MNVHGAEVRDIDRDLFEVLARNLPCGTEDTFTALLATTATFVPELGQEILEWLRKETGSRIPAGSYKFSAQCKVSSAPFVAIVDMVASSEDAEVWFEHKLDARENRYGTGDGPVGQIEKYVRAARKAVPQGKQIWIAFCCRDECAIKNRGSLPLPDDAPVAVANPRSSALRWHSLYKWLEGFEDRTALDERQKWLVGQMFRYWRSLRRMRLSETGPGWAPDRAKIELGRESWLKVMWSPVRALLQERLPGTGRNADRGLGLYHAPARGPVAQLHVHQGRASDVDGWHGQGAVLRCDVTVRDGADCPALEDHFVKDRRDRVGRTVLTVVWPIEDWDPGRDPRELGERLGGLLLPLLERIAPLSDGAPSFHADPRPPDLLA